MTPQQQTAKDQSAVMLAFAEGKIVRFRDRLCKGEWRIMHPDQRWDWVLYEFEVKTEERKPREWVIRPHSMGVGMIIEEGPFIDERVTVREVLPETETE